MAYDTGPRSSARSGMDEPDTHDRALRGRFHAWFLQATEATLERIHGERKRALFAELPDRVVELGPGTGANCRHFRPGQQVIGIEPNLRMHDALHRKAQQHGVDLEIRGLRGERLDLPDASVPAVVSSLVLCSVGDPAAVLGEVRRVLEPGGRFVFIEHVIDPSEGWLRRSQQWLRAPHSFCFEGCEPDRDTEQLLRAAGFASLELERFRIRSPLFYVAPHIAGVARK